MRLRTTSEGYVWEAGSDPLQALLYDFDVGSARLKSAHAKYLDEKVVARVLAGTGKTWKVKLEGRASRTGSAELNLNLSRDRAETVFAYLTRKAPKAKLSKDWVGEALAEREGEKDGKENMFYRAVEVVVRSEGVPSPPPMKHSPPKPALPPARKTFFVRVLGGSSSSVSIPIPGPPGISPSLSRDHYTLEFWDKEEGITATYLFDGMGKGLGAGLKISAGVTLSGGPWNEFTAPRYIAVDDFRGPAMFEFLSASYVAGSAGPTAFSFRPLHWYSMTFGFRISPFQMGRTIGTPGVTVGDTTGELKFIKKVSGSP